MRLLTTTSFEPVRDLRRLERIAWVILATVGAAAIAGYVAAWALLSDEQLRPAARVLMAVCYAAAALLCGLRIRSAGAERVAWATMATAVAVDLAGWLLYWMVIEGLDPVPFPSVADALWLSAYALYYVALLALLRARVARFEPSAWLDGAIGALALGALSAVLVFAPVLASTGGNRLAVITNLGYPLGDVLVLSLVVMTFAFSGWRPGRAWLLVGGAMSVKVVADSIYLYQSSAGTWEQGSLLNVSWPAVVLLIALSAWMQPQAHARLEMEGRRMMAVPVAFAAVALGVLVYGSVADVSLPTVVLATSALTLAAVRSGFTFTRARRLAEQSRRAEAALRQAESRFRSAFEEAPIGMAMVALDGRFLSVNRALCQITGYAREELETRSYRCITHPDDVRADDEALAAMLAGSAHQQTEKRYLHAGGRVVPVLLSATLVRDAEGEPLHVLTQVQDITERKRFEGQLQYLADHDSLTGLFNRRRFEEELAREQANAERYGHGAALLAIDLDNFKYINDSLGHAVGDQLIARLGDALRSRLRSTDVLARLGGDEFAAILPRADQREALHVAESLLDAVGRIDLLELGGRTGATASASIGIAVFGGSRGLSPDELLVRADIAMYDAKEAGRARAVVYDGDADGEERMRARMTWVERIRDALASDRFVLHAQRILCLDDDDPRPRCELLIRMLGEDGDVIPPASFLPVAERFDLIQELDRRVLARAIGVLAAEQAAGHDPVLSVNLSAKSVTDPGLPEFIAALLGQHGADGRGLCFELTETAAIVNVDRAQRLAAGVRSLGCELALDDFGAGFASFYYLKHLEFDVLKIDGEFVRDLAGSPVNQLVVKSVVDIARGLGKRTTAEFVGDAGTLDLVRALGVDYAQGFHIARPAPVADDHSVTGVASCARATS